jgi:alcohol dehydrogenase (cytochrome c)
MNRAKAGLSAIALTIALAASPAIARDISIEEIDNAANVTTDVLTWGLGNSGQRFSPLKQVDKASVKRLVPAWSFSFGGEKQRGQEAQPIIADGVIYVTGSYSRLFAINAKTGEKLWQYEAKLPEGILPCCDVINRGPAIYKDKIYFGTLDAQLVALNRQTGKVVWKKEIDDFHGGYSYSAAPMVVPSKAHGPLLLTGVSGGEFGVVGRVEARNAETGELVWSRPVLEGLTGTLNGKETTMTGKANESWPGDMYKFGGGATWLGGTYDNDTKLAFFGTGNPAPWNSHLRPGDNKWTASRIAIDPENGEIKWGFQTTPHDGWDYDGVNEFVSFDLKKDGKTIKAGATADRNGFFYVLDRTNGKFINATPFVEKINWAKSIDSTGRPVYEDANRPGDPSKSQDGKQGKEVFAVPSFLGGKNQMPMAYSQNTGLFYVPSNEWGMDIHNEPVAYKKGAAYLGAGFTIHTIFEDHIGALKAIDPATGKIVWQVNNKAPLWGGVLTTAGGLVFTGTPEGYLKAFDDKTGEVLWQFNVGTGIVAPPVTWTQDGEQYVGVAAGWGGAVPLWGGDVAKQVKDINQGGSFWVFKLSDMHAAK